jgi:hypothetical protein
MPETATLKPGRPFRWTGGVNGSAGVLIIRKLDGSVTVVPPNNHRDYLRDPRSIVRKVENLLALGSERIEDLIKQGLAEPLGLADKIFEAFDTEPPKVDDDISQGERLANESAQAGKAIFEMAQAAAKAGAPMAHDDRTDEQRVRDGHAETAGSAT